MDIARKICLPSLCGLFLAATLYAQSGPYQYYPLTPCRIVDTRNPNGVNGGPVMGATTQRDFAIRGNCGVPTTAKAVAINLAIVTPTASSGNLTVWPSGSSQPLSSAINFVSTDYALANGAITGLSTNAQDLSVYNNSGGTVHIIIDVNGYFQ